DCPILEYAEQRLRTLNLLPERVVQVGRECRQRIRCIAGVACLATVASAVVDPYNEVLTTRLRQFAVVTRSPTTRISCIPMNQDNRRHADSDSHCCRGAYGTSALI